MYTYTYTYIHVCVCVCVCVCVYYPLYPECARQGAAQKTLIYIYMYMG